MCFAPQWRALFRHLNIKKWSEQVVLLTFSLGNVLCATTASTFSTSQLPKVVRSWCVLYILTWKCASRHNGVHFLDISTAKSGPMLVCFVHFDSEMCFAPQRTFSTSQLPKVLRSCGVLYILTSKFASQRLAFFRHLNCQKWSEAGVFCTFWLRNVLRATTACNFSSLIWPAGSAPAALTSLPFDPPEPQIIGKNTVNRDFPTFSCTCIFFLRSLSLLWPSHFFSSPLWLFPPLLFQLSISSEVWLLNFLRSCYVTMMLVYQWTRW